MSLAAAYPFLKAMGWALVNSLWQFAICWLLYRAITVSAKKLSSSTRHLLGIAVLFGGTLSFLCSLSFKYYYQEQVIMTNSSPGDWIFSGNKLDALMPYWSMIYIVCVFFLLAKFFLFVRNTALIRYQHTEKMPVAWRMYIERIAQELAISRKVQAFVSAHIDTPQVIGYLKPVILLPAACLANLTTAQLEAVLLHELVHIKRNDYFLNLIVSAIEILFFFNPFVKQITKTIRREREYSCDDMVIQYRFQPHHYASALLLLEKNRVLPVSYGIAASGKNEKQLLARVKRIMGVETRPPGMLQGAVCLLALFLLAMIALLNPAKLAVDGFSPASMALANQNLDNMVAVEEVNKPVIVKLQPATTQEHPSQAILLSKVPGEKLLAVAVTEPKKDDDDVQPEDITEVAYEPVKVQTVAAKQSIDYSMHGTAEASTPEPVAKELSVPEPYVPGNSFSFQLTEDTSMPKLKTMAFNEQAAKLSKLNAELALSQINWDKLQKQMNYSQKEMAKLKSTITAQLQKLNWEQINATTQLQMNQQMLNEAQQTFERDQTIRQYRQMEEYNHALLQKVQEDQELLKLSRERALEDQHQCDTLTKKSGKLRKTARIIYF